MKRAKLNLEMTWGKVLRKGGKDTISHIFNRAAGKAFVPNNNIGEITNKMAAISALKVATNVEDARCAFESLIPRVKTSVTVEEGYRYNNVVEYKVSNYKGRDCFVYEVNRDSLGKFEEEIMKCDVNALTLNDYTKIADDFDKIGRFLQETSIDVFKKEYMVNTNVNFISSDFKPLSACYKAAMDNSEDFFSNKDKNFKITLSASNFAIDKAGYIMRELASRYENLVTSSYVNLSDNSVKLGEDKLKDESFLIYCHTLYSIITGLSRSLKKDEFTEACLLVRNAIITEGRARGLAMSKEGKDCIYSVEDIISTAIAAGFVNSQGKTRGDGKGAVFALKCLFPVEYTALYLNKTKKEDFALTIIDASVDEVDENDEFEFEYGYCDLGEGNYIQLEEDYTGIAVIENNMLLPINDSYIPTFLIALDENEEPLFDIAAYSINELKGFIEEDESKAGFIAADLPEDEEIDDIEKRSLLFTTALMLKNNSIDPDCIEIDEE